MRIPVTPAKAGDAEAALVLAGDLMRPEAIAQLQDVIGGRPAILLPVVADETGGFNAIPDAMAQLLAHELGLVAQAVKSFRSTRSDTHELLPSSVS
jgi:hypothetical protein